MYISIRKFGEYQGKWIALNLEDEKVLASGKDVLQVTKKLKKWDPDKVLFKYIIPFNLNLAPSAR